MAVGDIIANFVPKIKEDKGFLIRIIVGVLLILVTIGLGFGLLIRTWVYQTHIHKFALEYVGWNDPNFVETFPQFSICPGYHNNTQTHKIEQGVITGVQCNFHDITPLEPHNHESTQKKDETKPIAAIRGPKTHVIDFRQYTTCYDINFDAANSPKIKWLDSHSHISCRVGTNTYVHVHAYGFNHHRPSHVLSHYNNVKNGEATLLSVRAEEVSTAPGITFYEIDREDEELRFHTGGHNDHLWITMSFSRFTKKRYQAFHGAHQQTDITLGVIGGFGLFFFMLYKLVALLTTIFFTSSRVGYETTQ